ncbi:MAG: hypothetical protein LBM61_07420 [Prevotellaceae bacterium]|jgi:hypothetical protein|nr:hypothetical protein [Prevotellaceae bacterium]
MKRKLIPKKELPPIDSVAYEKRISGGDMLPLLYKAARAWDNLNKFRKDRERSKRYLYGDQWGDMVTVCINGKQETMTEEKYILKQGNIPLKNNLIRRLVKTVLGTYRNQNKKPIAIARDREEQQLGETMSALLEYNYTLNEKKELDARMFEEFCMSGLAVQKESFGIRENLKDCYTDNINPQYFFLDGALNDPRMKDLSLIGELHDLTLDELCSAFAHSDADVKRFSEIYKSMYDRSQTRYSEDTFGRDRHDNSFYTPNTPNLCRVIELWTRETRKSLMCHDWLHGDAYIDSYSSLPAIKAENAARLEENKMRDAAGNYIMDESGKVVKLFMPMEKVPLIEYEYFIETYWYFRFLSPFGDILQEGETPYEHGSHPYTVKAYPLIDGEIHSFVSDVIDQQRFFNRYVILNDFITKASAKGVLIVDEDSIPADMSIDDVSDQWVRYDGVIKLNLKNGAKPPQQMANTQRIAGLNDMIQLQAQLMEDVSGVHGAMQGKQASSSTSGYLYQQQAANASNSIVDILETYSNFILSGTQKKMQNMQQFYDEQKTVRVAGRNAVVRYNPAILGGVKFDLSVSESFDTPVYRALNNDFLLQMLNLKQITVEDVLQVGHFPFADQLLQLIQARKQELTNTQQPMPPAGANPAGI